jgi:hypothetical protein
VTDEFTKTLVSRRSFLFTLAAVTCFGLTSETKAASSFAPFTFAYVTDTHVTHGKPDSYLLLQESQLFLQDCIKSLNNEKLDFVIFGGDQVETPGPDETNWQLFVDVVQVLSCPWSFVLGEKDVSGNPPVDKMRLYGPDWKAKGIQTDKPYWSQTPLPGVHIIGMDTSRAESTTGDISNEQLEWLKKDLAANAGKFTIVFSHHPLLAPPPFDTGPPWDDYITPQGASAREILGGSKDVHLAISGHLHVNKIQQERDIWYVSTASLDVYPCCYRIFRVTPESITVETYQITYPALIKKAKQQLDSSTLSFKYNEVRPQAFAELAFGSRLDNSAILPLVAGQAARPIDEKRLKQAEKERKKNEQTEAPAKEEKKPKSEKKNKQKEEKVKEDKKEDHKKKQPDKESGSAKSDKAKSDVDLDKAPSVEPDKAPSADVDKAPSADMDKVPADKTPSADPDKAPAVKHDKTRSENPDKAPAVNPDKAPSESDNPIDTKTTKSEKPSKKSKSKKSDTDNKNTKDEIPSNGSSTDGASPDGAAKAGGSTDGASKSGGSKHKTSKNGAATDETPADKSSGSEKLDSPADTVKDEKSSGKTDEMENVDTPARASQNKKPAAKE